MDMDLSNLLDNLKAAKAEQDKAPVEEDVYIDKSDLRKEVITYLEVEFWLKGDFPTELQILEQYSSAVEKQAVLKILRSEDLVKALNNRGLPNYENRSSVRGFHPEAVIAANMIADIYDKRSIGAKLKSLGLNTRQWQGFLKNRDFKAYFTQLVNSRFDEDVSTIAKVGLGKLVENADLNAIKYFHELTGEYRPHNEEVIQLHMIIARMMEILAEFVTPEILGQIANKLDTVIEVKELTP